MKIKIDTPLFNASGKEVLKDEKGELITLKSIITNILLLPNKEDTEKQKFEKWEIFKKVRDAKDDADLKTEEVAIIKKAIGIYSPPLILGQCFEIIESV